MGTTAHTLTAMLWNLSKYPENLEKVKNEINLII
jgi:cytochrome P450